MKKEIIDKEMNFKTILNKIKELNPLNLIEEADANTWLKYCKEDLTKSYKEYLKAVERVNRINRIMNKTVKDD